MDKHKKIFKKKAIIIFLRSKLLLASPFYCLLKMTNCFV